MLQTMLGYNHLFHLYRVLCATNSLHLRWISNQVYAIKWKFNPWKSITVINVSHFASAISVLLVNPTASFIWLIELVKQKKPDHESNDKSCQQSTWHLKKKMLKCPRQTGLKQCYTFVICFNSLLLSIYWTCNPPRFTVGVNTGNYRGLLYSFSRLSFYGVIVFILFVDWLVIGGL